MQWFKKMENRDESENYMEAEYLAALSDRLEEACVWHLRMSARFLLCGKMYNGNTNKEERGKKNEGK